MATTTDYITIRDNYIALLQAATPALLAQLPFKRGPRFSRLVEWAPQAESAAFRAFELRRADEIVDPPMMSPAVVEREEYATLTVAYPVLPALYGTGELDEMECVMRSDAVVIRQVIYAPTHYVVAQSLGFVVTETPDRSDERCWFQTYRIRLIYSEAQTLF